ncbi:MAG: hypothetical protein JWR83_1744 [Aeromicrobium sp.]|nr:hypothetical protein [Aeromicrobium sp.]
MEFDEPGWQLIDDFVQQLAAGRKPETVRRYARVRDQLTHFLDTAEMSFDLGVGPATLLEAEREFHEHGAFWLIYGPEELVACLPGFISQPWLPDSAAGARVQISVIVRLVDSLGRAGTVSPAAIADVKRAITYERHQLERRSAVSEPDERATHIPQRLLRKPAAEW